MQKTTFPFKKLTALLAFLLLASTQMFAQPANDDCSGAIALETFVNDGTINDGVMAIYSGTCTASGLTLIQCDDDGSTAPGNFERIELLGRTPGETLLVRVWSFNNADSGTFNICAIELNPLGTPDNTLAAFKMYPNPANDIL